MCKLYADMKRFGTTHIAPNAFKVKPHCVLGQLPRNKLCKSQKLSITKDEKAIWVKMVDCETCLDYNAYKTTDGASTSLANVDVDQCQAHCQSHSSCAFWNYNFDSR